MAFTWRSREGLVHADAVAAEHPKPDEPPKWLQCQFKRRQWRGTSGKTEGLPGDPAPIPPGTKPLAKSRFVKWYRAVAEGLVHADAVAERLLVVEVHEHHLHVACVRFRDLGFRV